MLTLWVNGQQCQNRVYFLLFERRKDHDKMDTAVIGKYDINPSSLQGGDFNITAFGGPLGIRWDPDANVTRWGGMAYFANFLKVSEMFERLVADAPFEYASNNAPDVRDVVGTMVLAILAGFKRYCHIDRLRNDTTCAELLGMKKVVSDESVRRALKRCDEAKLEAWLSRHEREVTEALLQYPYIIDIDNSVKLIYGHQEGAELGYNPDKPGRPSLNCHSSFIGTVRMTLTVDVQGGKNHSGICGLPSLWGFIDALPAERRPRLLRGDVGYGNETTMLGAESRLIKYLFKIKRSRKVCALFKTLETSRAWKPCGDGWETIDTTIRLDGWSILRRCLLFRRPTKAATAPAPKKRGRPKKNEPVPVQAEFEFVEDCKGRMWDTFALVTNDTGLDHVALMQLYRDRGDCENNFDEYKNHWGWSGFVTNMLKPTRAMARLIAIVANWWNVFCRLADGEKHMEPVTSRPMLLGLVGRIVRSGRQRLMHLTSTHVEADRIRTALTAIGVFLGRISATAPQLDHIAKWTLILRVAFRKFLDGRPSEPLSDVTRLQFSTT